jgi:hypothetical protein
MIKYVKLMTGEEVVCELDETSAGYFMKWPARVTLVVDPTDNTAKNKIEPFLMHVKGHSIFLEKEKVFYVADPVNDLAEYYDKTFGNMVPKAVPAANEG